MHLRHITLVSLLLLTLQAGAQYQANVHSISRSDGLSNGAVNTIIKDAEGYVWLGTWNGLNRFDGANIRTYLPANNTRAIHNHVIRELYPTPSGSIWILTNKGIAWYDNVHDRFTSFFTREPEQINYENDVSLTCSDGYGPVVSVYGRGIFAFDSVTRQFTKIPLDTLFVPVSLTIKRIHLVNNQVFMIDDAGKLLLLSGKSLLEQLQLPLGGAITSLVSVTVGKHRSLLITRRSGAALMVDLESKTVKPLKLPDDVITTFSRSGDKNSIWAGTDKGRIYRINLNSRTFELLKGLSGLKTVSPVETRILSLYETEPDLLWIGTDGNGVYTLKLSEFPIRRIASNQLAYPIVRSILVTGKGDVLVGTKGGGIDIFDASGRHIKGITMNNGLSNNSVLSFHDHGDGWIWVGTDGNGVDLLSADYQTIRHFPRDFKITNPVNFGSVYRILEDTDHRIYLGTSGYGVILVDFNNNRPSLPVNYERVILDGSADSLAQQNQIVYALAEERPGVIWIGTRGMGVYRYNTINKRVIAQYSTSSNPGEIMNDDILSLFTESNGKIWAGTSNGLFSLLPVSADSVQVTGLNSQSDLANTSIHTVQADAAGNLWVTTNLGLSQADIRTRNIRSFNSNDGLINIEYSDGASYFDKSRGRLYVGGTMGIDIIQTDEMKYSSYFPPIAINQLSIKNLPVEPDSTGILTSRINHQKSLTLKYNQNSLSFVVAPLVFRGQERYRLSYRMLNFDKDWILNPPNQHLSFSNLKPGKYTLEIRVSDENGNWSDKIRMIDITIRPAPWLTSYAIAGYIFIFIGIQVLLFAAYRRRVTRKREALLLEYQKIKEEELQAYKIEFFTNVAHEFRTPLTLISSHIHTLLEDPHIQEEKPRLLKIFNNSIRLQKLVLEIMQFRKLEKGKEPLNVQLTRPVDLAKEVVSDLELFARQGNIRCEVIAADPEILFKTDADKFQRILTNLLSNAIKYNRPGGFVRIFIKIEELALKVEVEDNGVGISPANMEKVFEPFGVTAARKKGSFPGYRSTGLGLAVTRGLVELMKGTISFKTVPHEGTLFICLFPDTLDITPADQLTEPENKLGDINYFNEDHADPLIPYDEGSAGKPLILLVDDDPEILELLHDFLRGDYHILFAENGLEEYHKVISEKPDLIVSDVKMPEMDGIELCQRLRENFDTSHLPIILLAAKAEIEDRIAGLKAGADSYIPKPFHPEHLKVRITKLLQLRVNILNQFGKQEYNHSLVKAIPDPFFQKLLNFIDENIDDETLSSEKLCDKLAISKSSLYNKTKSVLGTTPHSLIYQRRLSKAALLLSSTIMTVSEIIDQTGFSSRTHFYELFSKSYGCSPTEYRHKRMN